MTMSSNGLHSASAVTDVDAVVIGASVAGSTTATLLARRGARVALVEKSADLEHHKQLCTHEIIALAVPVFTRLGIMDRLVDTGAARGPTNIWTRYGWVNTTADGHDAGVAEGINVRRSVLDPLIRSVALETPGVDFCGGTRADEIMRAQSGRPTGVRVVRRGVVTDIRARVVIGADGATSKIAGMADLDEKKLPHNRFGYAAYFRGVPRVVDPAGAPTSRIWMLDPDMAYAFPTDDDLTLLCCAPLRTDDRVASFKADIEGEFLRMMAALPDGPDLSTAERVGPWRGLVKSENIRRRPSAPGVALVGDAAQVTDFVWGTGCGFAVTSAEWLADRIGPMLADGASDARIDAGLRSYRRKHRWTLEPHYRIIAGFSTGRPFSPVERLLFHGGAHDERVARAMGVYGSRTMSPLRALTPPVIARAAIASTRDALATRGDKRVDQPA